MPGIQLMIVQEDGEAFPVEMELTEPVSKLQEYAEMVTGIPQSHQLLVHNTKAVPLNGSIGSAQIGSGDMIIVVKQSPEDREKMMQQQHQQEWQQATAAANAEPIDMLDPEYQRKMYEAIRQKNVEENWQHALEHSPEVFTQVEMLYVDMVVNNEPVKAFIDSGAQMTIMTAPCAEKCGIMRLMDTRYQGMAVGVGSSKILGKIHTCPMKVGSEHITTSVTILEQKGGPQFIFGLDNLKRHHCSINLRTHSLEIGSCNIAVPFLPEHQVPKDFNVERQRSDAAEGDAMAKDQPSQSDAAQPNAASTASEPAATGQPAAGAGAPSPSAPPAAQPAPAQPAAGAPAAAGASEADVTKGKQLQEITGVDLAACMAALRATGGNIDLAAASLMGF